MYIIVWWMIFKFFTYKNIILEININLYKLNNIVQEKNSQASY